MMELTGSGAPGTQMFCAHTLLLTTQANHRCRFSRRRYNNLEITCFDLQRFEKLNEKNWQCLNLFLPLEASHYPYFFLRKDSI